MSYAKAEAGFFKPRYAVVCTYYELGDLDEPMTEIEEIWDNEGDAVALVRALKADVTKSGTFQTLVKESLEVTLDMTYEDMVAMHKDNMRFSFSVAKIPG